MSAREDNPGTAPGAPRRVRRWLFLLALVVLAGGGIWYLRRPPPPLEVELVQVSRGQVKEIVSSAAAGEVKPARRVTVRAEIAGTVAEVKRRQGERVAQGELLVRFSSEDLEARTAQAEANLEAARVAARMAETRSKTAARALERARKLKEKDAVSEVELERAETEASALSQAVEQARAAERQALAALRLADVARKKAQVHAPFPGVLQSVSAELGVQLAPGQPLFDLIDDAALRVDVPVDEADSGKIFPGQVVSLRTDAVKAPIAAKVALIPPAVGKGGELGAETALLASKERWLYVQVVPDERVPLLVGASVNAEFLVSVKEDVLFVPSHVVLGRGAKRAVYRVEEGKARRAPFTAGLVSWDRTEVTGGLALGDTLVASLNVKELEEGVPVRARAEQR